VEHLATWTESGLCQAEEQRDPNEHHGNREQLAAGAAKECDIPEAGGGERRYCEVKGVHEILDLRLISRWVT
jgi:hypothetical protein